MIKIGIIPFVMSLNDTAENDWSNYEAKVQDKADETAKYETQQNDLFPRRKILHKFFILYSLFVGLTAVLLGIGNFLVVFYEDVGTSSNEILYYVISVYLLLMCITAVLVELEYTMFVADSKLLIHWVTRGIIYVFIGVLSLSENQIYGTKNPFGETFVRALSYTMMGCGAVYTLMGAACLQLVLNRYRFDFKARQHAAGEKQEDAVRDGTVLQPPTDLEIS